MNIGNPISKKELQNKFNPEVEKQKEEELKKIQQQNRRNQIEQKYVNDFKVHVENIEKVARKGETQYILYVEQSQLFLDPPKYPANKIHLDLFLFYLNLCKEKFPDLKITSTDMNIGELRNSIHNTHLNINMQGELKKYYEKRKEMKLNNDQLYQLKYSYHSGKFIIIDWS